jgi:hypothetical protein
MANSDKLVAAILAAAKVAMSGSHLSERYVEQMLEMLTLLSKARDEKIAASKVKETAQKWSKNFARAGNPNPCGLK